MVTLASDHLTEYVAARDKTIALIPAFNEERFIGSVVLKARRFVESVIVIDDGSTDETVAIAEAAGAMVHRQGSNQGKAAALQAGLTLAREMDAQAVVLLDGDGQHDPKDIPAMLAPIQRNEADMVVGSRFIGLASNTPRWRIFGQQALTTATNFASGVTVSDSQSGYRALSRRAIECFDFKTKGFSVESEMQFLVKQHALKVVEVAVAMNYDEGPKRNPVQHGLQVLNGVLRMIGQHRPLLFFSVPGVFVLISGLLIGYFNVVAVYNTYSVFAVGSALIAITLVITGLLTIFTGLILHTIRAYMTA